MQTSHDSQTKQDDLGPANGAHGLALQWIDDGNEALHGEGHHKPDGAEAGQVAEEREELAKVVLIIDIHIEEVQPLCEESGQEAGVAHCESGQVKAGGQLSQLGPKEDKHGEDIANAARAAKHWYIVLMHEVPYKKGYP